MGNSNGAAEQRPRIGGKAGFVAAVLPCRWKAGTAADAAAGGGTVSIIAAVEHAVAMAESRCPRFILGGNLAGKRCLVVVGFCRCWRSSFDS